MKKSKGNLILVYPDFLSEVENQKSGGNYSEGLASISAVVKKAGYDVNLIHITECLDKKAYIDRLKAFDDITIVGISVRTTAFDYAKKLAKWTKEYNKNLFVMAGGYHAILVPDEFMADKNFDAVCLGEGEYPTLELMEKLITKKDYTKVKSFYFRKNGKIIKNEVAPLIEDLDLLPFPDIELFDYKALESTKIDTALIMLSRGCIYACTYCGNSQFRNVYPNKEKYARFRSPKKAILLIKNVLSKYPNIKYINFRDAIFNMFPKWFDEFIDLYTKEIKLPFTCNLRFDIVTEDVVKRMKEAGCYVIDIGLESGNKEIRQKYLKRFTTDEQMINCSKWFNKYKIRVMTYNIIGLPYEDLHKALETVKLNAKLKSNQIVPNIFYPYPMTVLKNTAEEAGFLREITPKTRVFIKQPQFPDHEVLFVVRYFMYYVKRYKWCYQKNTKFRHFMEHYYDFWFTGPLTPRRLLVFLADTKEKMRDVVKNILINKFPKLYLYLRGRRDKKTK